MSRRSRPVTDTSDRAPGAEHRRRTDRGPGPPRPSVRRHAPADLRRRDGAVHRTRVRGGPDLRSEEHTSELQSRQYLVCRLLLEKKRQYADTYLLRGLTMLYY